MVNKDIGNEEWDKEDLLNEQQQKEAKEFRELFWKNSENSLNKRRDIEG